jgi:alkylation response protein AidB-like acyl-CoA dehydrogenase
MSTLESVRDEDVPRTQERMSHDLWLPTETVELRTRARAVAQECVAPYARDIGLQEESVDAFPWTVFRGLADAGLFALPFGGPDGGRLAHPTLGACTVTEELAYHSSSVAGIYDAHAVVVPPTFASATPVLRERLTAELRSGRTVFSFAVTEPGSTSDLAPERLATVAEREPDGFRLTGVKRWITNSPVAGWAAVLARAEQTDRATMLLVDLSTPGVRVGTPDLKMGQRGQITADIVFDDVLVPAENLVGEWGSGLAVALSALVHGRIGVGAMGVGIAQAALDLAVHRAQTRHVFGGPLGRMQHWQLTLARHATEIEAARALYQKAATLLDRGDRTAEPEAAMAKYYGTRVANDLVRDAIQIHGAVGYARQVAGSGESVRLEEMYRDAKILEIAEGANEIQQWIIARRLMGREVTG